MKISLPPRCDPAIPEGRSGSAGRVRPGSLIAAALVPVLLAPWMAASAEHSANPKIAHSLFFFILFGVGIISLSVSLIVALTLWSHRQDQIQCMMRFCIRYLVESKNESEKIEAVTALGQAKDPAALLILLDVVDNEKAGEELRDAADAALREMGRKYPQFTSVIDAALAAVEEKSPQKVIDLLVANFEQRKKKYVQSAYLIGREYMRMEQYAEALAWLQKARMRNRKTHVYFHQISRLISTCNQQLLNEGDVLFRVGEYAAALERYALASHELKPADKEHHALHLRLACTYCKLAQYEDAYRETLLALQEHHKTEPSLSLSKLLHQMLSEVGTTAEVRERRDKLVTEIADQAENTMSGII